MLWRLLEIILFAEWPEMFPKCGEPNSSPIEINLDTDGPFKRLNSTLKFLNYDANISLIVENTGHGGKYIMFFTRCVIFITH
jgi:hypothetical protein